MSARVADVMAADVVAVRASASFKQITAGLREQRVSAVPVLDDDDQVIGVVSEADLLPKEALEAGYEGHPGRLSRMLHRSELAKSKGVTAADLMSAPPVTIGPYELVSHAAHLMYDRKINCLPVVYKGQLAGMVSRADVLSVFSRSDDEIRREVTEKVIVRERLADPASFTITVTDGIVALDGRVETAAVAHGIANGVRHMEGVVAVRERMSYPANGSRG